MDGLRGRAGASCHQARWARRLRARGLDFFDAFPRPRQARVGHEILVRVEGLLALGGLDPLARARRQYTPALLVVEEIRHHDLVEHLLMHRRVEDRQQRLHPAVEVAAHQVRRRDVDPRLGVGQADAVAEGVDPAMLQEPPDDRLDPDVLRQARHAGPEAADAAHHAFDHDAGLAGIVERVDDLGVDQRVALDPDRRRPPAFAWAISSAMCSMRRFFRVSGETAIRSSSAGSA